MTEKIGREEKQLSLKPNTILAILRRRSKLESFNKINKRLGITKSDRLLNDFINDFPRLLEFMEKMSSEGYSKKHYTSDERRKAPELMRLVTDLTFPDRLSHVIMKSLKTREQMAKRGYWPYGLNVLPPTFTPEFTAEGDVILRQVPEKAKIMREAFKRVADGEVPNQVSKDVNTKLGVCTNSVMNYFRNVLFVGFIPWKGKRAGRIATDEKPITDPETFERVRKRFESYKKMGMKLPRATKFAMVRVGTRRSVDKHKIPLLREICTLRKDKKALKEIYKTILEKYGVRVRAKAVTSVFRDKAYRNAVGEKLWNEAHNADVKMRRADYYASTVRDKNWTSIVLFLQEHGPATTGEIVKGLSERGVLLGRAAVKDHLKRNQSSIVGREQKHFGRWFLLEKGPPDPEELTKAEEKVLATLATPHSIHSIRREAKVGRTTVIIALRKLVKEGLVEKRSEPGKQYPVYVKLSRKQEAT
jgi:hypothetical protein